MNTRQRHDTAAGSLNRALILLTTIARGSRQGSSLSDLVARSGLPRPTIHRILDRLIGIGWIIRNADNGRFNLGIDLAALGYSAISRHPIERVAATELSALAATLKQVVYLGIRSGLDMVCIGRYETGAEVQVGRGWVGMRGPFGMTPACMGMFARLPADEVAAVVRTNMSRYHRIQGFDESHFHQDVAESLQTGNGIYHNILLDRTTSGLGMAICDPSGYPIAGIGTTFITDWLNEEQQQQCLLALKQTATHIARDLFITQAE